MRKERGKEGEAEYESLLPEERQHTTDLRERRTNDSLRTFFSTLSTWPSLEHRNPCLASQLFICPFSAPDFSHPFSSILDHRPFGRIPTPPPSPVKLLYLD